MSVPIVYCETNWIVALAFPHHQLHRAAKKLRENSKQGKCELRIPLASLLEARGTLSDVASQLSTSFASLRNSLATASTNGLAEFSAIAQALQSDVVDKYAQRNMLSILVDIEADRTITVLRDVTAHVDVVRELRPKVDFRGRDVVDLHLLAAIFKDRRESAEPPALLMSHNKKEFDPRRNKVPAELYEAARLLWRDDFELDTGLGQWNAKYSTK